MAENYGLDELLGDLFSAVPKKSSAQPLSIARKPAPAKAPPTKAPAATPPAKPSATGSSKGDRNNNPGNLEDGPFARSQPGYKGTDGRFAIFDSRANGEKAQITLLQKNYGGMSPAQIIQKYAPLGDNSEASVRNYIGYISKRTGISPDDVVDPAKLPQLAQAMREFETGKTVKGVQGSYGGSLGGRSGGGSTGNTPTTPNKDAQAWLDQAVPQATSSSYSLNENQSSAIFGDGVADRAGRRESLEAGMHKVTAGLTVLDAVTQAAQAEDLEQRRMQVQDTKQINQILTEGTQKLTAEAKPLIEARERIANQLIENQNMNPIEKALRGIFDANYDDEALKGQLSDFETILEAKGYNYRYMNALSADAVKEIDARYGLNMADSLLRVSQATEDMGILEKQVTNLSNLMQSGNANLADQTALISAQHVAREDVRTQLDDQTLQSAFAAAEKAGGQVSVGGATFSSQELSETMEERVTRKISVRSHQLAAAAGELEVADRIAHDIASKASRSEIEAALTNGGYIAGVKIDEGTLVTVAQNQRQKAAGMAADAVAKMPNTLVTQQLDALSGMSTQLYYRSKDMLGKEGIRAVSPYLTQISASHQQITEAMNSNQPPEVINALLAKHESLVKAVSDTVDSRILASVNGDKVLGGAISNFVRGIELTEGASIEVLTRAAIKGSMPEGLSLGPEAKKIFREAQTLVSQYRYKDAKGTPRSQAELSAIVADKLAPRIQSLVGNPRLARAVSNLPAYAKQAGNPLGRLKPQWWNQAYGLAQDQALTHYATELTRMGVKAGDETLSFKPSEVAAIMNGTFKDTATAAGKAKIKAVKENTGIYNARETQVIVKRLEDLHPFSAETTNSELFEDLLGSPELTGILDREEKVIRSGSFGDYVTGSLSKGATANTLSQYRLDVSKVTRARDDQGYENDMIDTSLFQSSRGRLTVMAQAMPGVGNAGANALAKVFSERAGRSKDLSTDLAVYNWLQTQKFEDPVLDGYRKRFVHEYPEVAKWIPAIHQSLVKTRTGVRTHLEGNR